MPSRIQRKRADGWRKPVGAVYVGRPTRWGNPYVVREYKRDWGVHCPSGAIIILATRKLAAERAVGLFRKLLIGKRLRFSVEDVRRELRGKDLMCWCAIGDPCHADVLLEIANGRAS